MYLALGGDALRSSDAKPDDVVKVCTQYHAKSWAIGDLRKSDAVIDVYNAVARAIKVKYYDPIKADGLDDGVKLNAGVRHR